MSAEFFGGVPEKPWDYPGVRGARAPRAQDARREIGPLSGGSGMVGIAEQEGDASRRARAQGLRRIARAQARPRGSEMSGLVGMLRAGVPTAAHVQGRDSALRRIRRGSLVLGIALLACPWQGAAA